MADAKTMTVNQYEGMFLLPAGAASDLDGAIKLVRGVIEKHGGKIQVIKKWDERKLAYELGNQKRGLYIITFFQAPGNAVTGIERDVLLSDQMLRVLVTRAEHLNETEMAAVEPQPIQPREERNPWDRPMGGGGYDRPPRDDRGGHDRGDRGGDRAGRGRDAAAEPAARE